MRNGPATTGLIESAAQLIVYPVWSVPVLLIERPLDRQHSAEQPGVPVPEREPRTMATALAS